MNKFLACIGFATLALSAVACDRIETHFDCTSVCHRYADCYDKSYDAEACKDRCEQLGSDASARQERVDTCNDCMDDKSCAAATYGCATQCAGIIP